jgi:hypothetical protein
MMSTLGGGNYCKFPLIKRDWSLMILAYLQGDRVMRDSVGPAQKATNKRVMGFPESSQRIQNLQAELFFFFFFFLLLLLLLFPFQLFDGSPQKFDP